MTIKTVGNWGNSRAIRIPAEIDLPAGTRVNVFELDGKIIIEPVVKKADWRKAMQGPLPESFLEVLADRPTFNGGDDA